jgi:flagellar biosynthesis/type III secretory pathway protein FliH
MSEAQRKTNTIRAELKAMGLSDQQINRITGMLHDLYWMGRDEGSKELHEVQERNRLIAAKMLPQQNETLVKMQEIQARVEAIERDMPERLRQERAEGFNEGWRKGMADAVRRRS